MCTHMGNRAQPPAETVRMTGLSVLTPQAFDEEHAISRNATALKSKIVEKSKAAVETAKPVATATWSTAVEKGKAAVETAKPVAMATASTVVAKSAQLKQRALDDPNVQQGWQNAQRGFAAVGAWASATAGQAQNMFSEATRGANNR